MASHKRSALRKQRDAFESSLGSMEDVFSQEERRHKRAQGEREAALRHKACSSKNRYPNKHEAMEAIAACSAHGKSGLQCYRCPYCGGWHLTSHPRP